MAHMEKTTTSKPGEPTVIESSLTIDTRELNIKLFGIKWLDNLLMYLVCLGLFAGLCLFSFGYLVDAFEMMMAGIHGVVEGIRSLFSSGG
jgi:hypothetical protein